jgi:hypothetical protein
VRNCVVMFLFSLFFFRLDIVVGLPNQIGILFNLGRIGSDSTFASPLFLDNPRSSELVASDVSGDSKIDLIASGNGVSVFINQGGRSFSPSQVLAVPSKGLAAADLNSDGRNDLAVSSGDSLSIFFNSRQDNALFRTRPSLFFSSLGRETAKVLAADLDQSGKPDLLVACTLSNYVSYISDSSGGVSFNNPLNYRSGSGPTAFAIGDWDNDTRIDFVSMDIQSQSLSFFIASSSFQPVVTSSSSGVSFAAYFGVILGICFGMVVIFIVAMIVLKRLRPVQMAPNDIANPEFHFDGAINMVDMSRQGGGRAVISNRTSSAVPKEESYPIAEVKIDDFVPEGAPAYQEPPKQHNAETMN